MFERNKAGDLTARKIAWTTLLGVAVLLGAVVGLAAFSDRGERSYASPEEAISRGLPHDVQDVIHVRDIDGVTVALYTFREDSGRFSHEERECLGVAFLDGGDREGWSIIRDSGGSCYGEAAHLTLDFDYLREYDRADGASRPFVVYGAIQSAEIVRVETRAQDEEAFEAADIIGHRGKRFYVQEGPELIVRGLAADGTVIEQQGG